MPESLFVRLGVFCFFASGGPIFGVFFASFSVKEVLDYHI